ncbi:MAG: 4-(cytidine 5'-diphospho)-2-C-methyl-D-erythritol kinase [Acidobacteria bacterium]|nr:MAG: 4-(cytidine 5'-diphospho)-2-C-methyl-D-erythritol kinase [Acidobacteriota bacterium]
MVQTGPLSLAVPCFAKINWLLKIEGRRPDGYHQITTIFQTIDLADRIRFTVTEDASIQLQVAGREVSPGPDNLLYRAVSSVKQKAGVGLGLRILLEKRIPVGGGLGGGSSNAAVGLLAANHLWNVQLSESELANLGSALGADVPFFLCGGTALGIGRGDEIRPLPDMAETPTLVLVYPGFPVPTSSAYQARDWGEYRGEAVLTTLEADNKIQRFRQAMAKGDLSWLENDFEEVLFELYPALAQVARLLREAGCEPVRVSGSGSCVFGVADPGRAAKIAQDVSLQAAGEVFLCRSLRSQEYRNSFASAGLEL